MELAAEHILEKVSSLGGKAIESRIRTSYDDNRRIKSPYDDLDEVMNEEQDR